MSVSRNQRRLQAKLQKGLLAPYRAVAARTEDREAAAAINGLINMVVHAMNEFGAFEIPESSRDYEMLMRLADAADDIDAMREIAMSKRLEQ